MTTKEILKLDANKHQVITIHKLHTALIRLIGKAKLSNQDLYVIADAIGVPRGLLGALKRDSLDDMTLTDYFRLKTFLYDISLNTIYSWIAQANDIDDEEENDSTEEPINKEEDSDRKFLIEVNNNLSGDSDKIDIDEAMEAKKECFDEDIKEDKNTDNTEDKSFFKGTAVINGKKYDITPDNIDKITKKIIDVFSDADKNDKINKVAEEVRSNAYNNYDKAVKEAQMELFGDTELLDNKTIGDLKYYIYKNHWENEFDLNLINNRQTVLVFLYRKLGELAEQKVKNITHISGNLQESLDKIKNYAKKRQSKAVEDAKKQAENININNNEPKDFFDPFGVFNFLNDFGFKF